MSGDLSIPLEHKIELGQGNSLESLNNNDVAIYKGSQFLAMNSYETYTNQRINMRGNAIVGVVNPLSPNDVATKQYVDNAVSSGGSVDNLTSSTLNLDWKANNGNNNGILFFDKSQSAYPLMNVGFGNNGSSSIFQVFSANQLIVGCNQNAIQFREGNNGVGGGVDVISNDAVQFVSSSGNKQNISVGTVECATEPTTDNQVATKKYVDDNITTQINYTQVIYGQNVAFRQNTNIPRQATDVELLKFTFTSGEALPTGNKYFLTVNIPCFLITNFSFGKVGLKVNGGTTITIFDTSTPNNTNQGEVPQALSFSSLIENATFPLIISVVASNNSSQGSAFNTTYVSRDDAIVSCKIEAVKSGSTGV